MRVVVFDSRLMARQLQVSEKYAAGSDDGDEQQPLGKAIVIRYWAD